MGILFLWLHSHGKNLNFALGLFNGKTFSINPPHLSQFAVEGMSLFLMKKLYWSSFVSSCLSRPFVPEACWWLGRTVMELMMMQNSGGIMKQSTVIALCIHESRILYNCASLGFRGYSLFYFLKFHSFVKGKQSTKKINFLMKKFNWRVTPPPSQSKETYFH